MLDCPLKMRIFAREKKIGSSREKTSLVFTKGTFCSDDPTLED